MEELTIRQAQHRVDEWIKKYGIRYFNELTNLAILTEEVGELARIISRTFGEQSFKSIEDNRDISDELADILWVVICLANQTGIDLTEAFRKNEYKKTQRDAERHINNRKLIEKMEKTDFMLNKFRETFSHFQAMPSDAEITNIVKTMIDGNMKNNFTTDVLKIIHNCIDLTTLTTLDTKESVCGMVENVVNNYEGTCPDVINVAAICVYPVFVGAVKQVLTAKDVKVAAVAGGFPSSQTFIEIKVAETALARKAGADEIDVVVNLGCFMEEDYETLSDELSEIKDSCQGAKLKVILETGALTSAENIRKAAILAVYSGADFIKTSTGKGYPGATPEAVFVMCNVIREYARLSGRMVGIKVSGGVNTAEDAVQYYTIVKEVLGDKWLNKNFFRIGASRLTEDIRRRLVE